MKKVRLGDHLEFKRGTTLSGKYYETSGEYIRLTLGNFDFKENCFKENTSKENIYFSGEFKEEFLLDAGDIITPLTEQVRGLLGSTAKIPSTGRYILSQDIAKVTSKNNEILLNYAYYLIPSSVVRKQLDVSSQQTKIRHTSVAKLEELVAYIPPLEQQKTISELLTGLDELSHNLRVQIAELEQTAQDLYNYWFVQFDFPDENGNPYRSSGGKMVWNEELKQEIPEGWAAGRIGDFFKVTMGQSPNGLYINETGDGIPFYQGATHFQKLFPFIYSYATSYSKEAKVGDLLLSVRAPVGRWNVAFTDCAIGRGLSAITPGKGGLFFLVGVIKTLGNVLDRMNSNGTTYGAINGPELKSLQFVCPSDELLVRFEQIAGRLVEWIFICENTLRDLLQLKKLLMPLLLNGQATIGSE